MTASSGLPVGVDKKDALSGFLRTHVRQECSALYMFVVISKRERFYAVEDTFFRQSLKGVYFIHPAGLVIFLGKELKLFFI